MAHNIEPKKKNRAFFALVLGAIVIAIAGALIAGHVHETTHAVNVPGQKLK
jgi:hypothetical protein